MRRVKPYEGEKQSMPALTQESQESRAYVLVEEARLRCERVEGDALLRQFRRIHREIGMAGLFASAELPSVSRQVLLEVARLRSEAPVAGALDAVSALEITFGRACAAVEDCLAGPGPVDHIHLAHIHALAATQRLNRWVMGDLDDA
jgi:hypothetical protein